MPAPKVELFPRPLKLGMEGGDVRQLQLYLLAHDSGPAAVALARHGITDKFGKLTLAAVIEFQKKHGVQPAQGVFGPATRAKILSEVPSPFADLYIFYRNDFPVDVHLIALSAIDWFDSYKRKLKTVVDGVENMASIQIDEADRLIEDAEAAGFRVKLGREDRTDF